MQRFSLISVSVCSMKYLSPDKSSASENVSSSLILHGEVVACSGPVTRSELTARTVVASVESIGHVDNVGHLETIAGRRTVVCLESIPIPESSPIPESLSSRDTSVCTLSEYK